MTGCHFIGRKVDTQEREATRVMRGTEGFSDGRATEGLYHFVRAMKCLEMPDPAIRMRTMQAGEWRSRW
jgi:hypothetical protein